MLIAESLAQLLQDLDRAQRGQRYGAGFHGRASTVVLYSYYLELPANKRFSYLPGRQCCAASARLRGNTVAKTKFGPIRQHLHIIQPHREVHMKKNWEIIREILLRLEASSAPNTYLNAEAISEYPVQEVAYNMRLLSQAGYIKAQILESRSGNGEIGAALAIHLTNTGHELLDTIRSESVWSKITDTFKSKGVEMTFDLVISVGKKVMESLLS